MRKVLISFMAMATLTVALALPAAAAVPGRDCDNSGLFGSFGRPSMTRSGRLAPISERRIPMLGNRDNVNRIGQLAGLLQGGLLDCLK